jgi:hypothetical protein
VSSMSVTSGQPAPATSRSWGQVRPHEAKSTGFYGMTVDDPPLVVLEPKTFDIHLPNVTDQAAHPGEETDGRNMIEEDCRELRFNATSDSRCGAHAGPVEPPLGNRRSVGCGGGMGKQARPLVHLQMPAARTFSPMPLSIECRCDRLNPCIVGWASRGGGNHVGRRSEDGKAPLRCSCRAYVSDIIEFNELNVVPFWRFDKAFVARGTCRSDLPRSQPGISVCVIHSEIIPRRSVGSFAALRSGAPCLSARPSKTVVHGGEPR